MASNQMSELIRNHNWTGTPLGSVPIWPSRLKTAVQSILDSQFPIFIWWGEHLMNIYNDAYIPVLGNRHPKAWAAGYLTTDAAGQELYRLLSTLLHNSSPSSQT